MDGGLTTQPSTGAPQGERLVSRTRSNRRISYVNVAFHQSAQPQMVGQGDQQEQAGVGHQAAVVEGDMDAVGLLAW